jgi:hypothetical protein
VADWTGQDLTALASVAPFRRFPLVVSLGAADLTGASNQRTPRLVGSASVAFGLGEVF